MCQQHGAEQSYYESLMLTNNVLIKVIVLPLDTALIMSDDIDPILLATESGIFFFVEVTPSN